MMPEIIFDILTTIQNATPLEHCIIMLCLTESHLDVVGADPLSLPGELQLSAACRHSVMTVVASHEVIHRRDASLSHANCPLKS